MRFNIYGRFQVEVRRENDTWVVYRAELGKRTPLNDVIIPSALDELFLPPLESVIIARH